MQWVFSRKKCVAWVLLFWNLLRLHGVPAGGALAVDRDGFSQMVTEKVANHPLIEVVRDEITELPTDVLQLSLLVP